MTDPVADVATLTDVVGECEVTPTAPTATDNCDGTITATPDVTFPITAIDTTTVTWTYTDNCGNTITQTQDVIVTAVDTSVSQSGADLTSNSTSATYQWLDCNDAYAPIAGETNQTYTATSNGSYAVEVTIGACVDTSACYDVEGIGFDELTTLIFEIYPNPSNGMFTLSFTNEISDASITITDMSGKIVHERLITSKTCDIDLSQHENGVYLLSIQFSEGIVSRTIVINK